MILRLLLLWCLRTVSAQEYPSDRSQRIKHEPTYFIAASRNVRPGQTYAVTVTVFRSALHVRASIQREGVELAAAWHDCKPNAPETLLIKVPPTILPGTYHLRVEGGVQGVLGGTAFHNETELQYSRRSLTIFIETDQPIYRQGQTIRFRAIPVTTDLRAFPEAVDVFILDPMGIVVQKWLSRQTNLGAVSLEYHLSQQPRYGNWTIRVVAQGQVEEKMIYIEEYYQTAFEVNVTLPAFILESERHIQCSVTANYSSGAPVPGNLLLRARLEPLHSHYKPYGQIPETKLYFNKFDGYLNIQLPMTELRRMRSASDSPSRLSVWAEVGERFLDQVEIGFAQALLYKADLKLAFLGANPQVFKPSMPFKCYVSVSFPDGSPLPSWRLNDQKLELRTKVRLSGGREQELETRFEQMSPVQFGIWEISVDLLSEFGTLSALNDVQSLLLEARYADESGERARTSLLVYASYTPTHRHLQVTTSTRDAKVGEYIIFHVRADYYVQQFYYMVVSKSSILLSGAEEMPSSLKTFAVPCSSEMAPTASLVVWDMAREGEVVADALTFPVDGLSRNNFSVILDEKKDKTGQTIEVVVEGHPGTYIGLSAVEHLLHKMDSGADLSPTEVLEKMNSFDEQGNGTLSFSWKSRDGLPNPFVHYPSPSYGMDARQIFQYAGLVIFTDAEVPQRPGRCEGELTTCMDGTCYRLQKRCDGFADCPDATDESGCHETHEPDIADFHRTRLSRIERMYHGSWIWEDIVIGPLGRTTFTVPAPSVPSTWLVRAFGMNSDKGFGLLPAPFRFSFIRPFVMNVQMPSKCKIGEQIGIRITVFNYLQTEIEALVILGSSPHYQFVNVETVTKTESETDTNEHHHLIFVKSGRSAVVYMPIVATTLGVVNVTVMAKSQTFKNIVTNPLVVQPEGIPQSKHTSVLLDLAQGAYLMKYMDTNLTESTVETGRYERHYVFGSNKATVSVTGDLIGAIFPKIPLNAESMLKKPDWCGEQNMFNFAANLYTLLYLRLTGQHDLQVERETFKHLRAGYQRQLSYQLNDGSFTVFRWNASPSVWLTAFCARVFHQAIVREWEPFITIDPKVIQSAIRWLLQQQSAEGSFCETTPFPYDRKMNLTSSRLKDPVKYRNISLTAHVLITLAEVSDIGGDLGSAVERARRSAQHYLEKILYSLRDAKDPYEIAIVTYALTLVGSDDGEAAFNALDAKMRETAGLHYWGREAVPPPLIRIDSNRPHLLPRLTPKYDALNVETTAYALLTHIKRQAVIQREIVHWINIHRSTDHGWASTQDTIVALQALMAYAAQNRPQNGLDVTVTVELPSVPGYSQHVQIDENNLSQLQTIQIPRACGTAVVKAQGTGVALVQLSVDYNVDRQQLLTPPPLSAFNLDVTVSYSGRNNSHIKLRSCQSWTLQSESQTSGMAVLVASIPTGYGIEQRELNACVQSGEVPHLREARFKEGEVDFYFEHLEISPVCVSFTVRRWCPVANMTRYLSFKVYDYYAPERYNETILDMYNLFGMNICQVCGSYQCPYCPVFNSSPIFFISLPLMFLLLMLSWSLGHNS
ncbi:CD109 antigen-like [Argiope bruennichi]|uniref:CD109 antigen-like n=1 Tax=Argiope bruennichi TaxID=94029 RepID=UPI002494B50C|nr:CD109 antigen-like [Argiope bruennichi]